MPTELRRKTPDELLRELQISESSRKKGYLKIFLGYASGVGKSFRMLDEARRRRERGQDVVVGAVQPQVPPEVDAVLQKLELIPLKRGNGGTEIDVGAILKRCPAVCFIDGLAYDNPPGSRNSSRWQDVQELLEAGTKVVASMNIQYVDELREDVESITGKRIKETVPASFIKSADEIEIVDAPAGEPIQRSGESLADGRTCEGSSSRDSGNWRWCWRRTWWTTNSSEYLAEHGITQHLGTHERILVCITPRVQYTTDDRDGSG